MEFLIAFTATGDRINGIMDAFDRIGDKLQFIQVRHEEMAAFRRARTPNSPARPGFVWPPPARVEWERFRSSSQAKRDRMTLNFVPRTKRMTLLTFLQRIP